MTPEPIRNFLSVPFTLLLARIMLTAPFWLNGFARLIDFPAGIAEMQQFGFSPPVAFNIAVIATQLVGSALVVANRWVWLGAGALAVFTALTVALVHPFWAMEGEQALHAKSLAFEAIGMIGGLILVSILSVQQRRASRYA